MKTPWSELVEGGRKRLVSKTQSSWYDPCKVETQSVTQPPFPLTTLAGCSLHPGMHSPSLYSSPVPCPALTSPGPRQTSTQHSCLTLDIASSGALYLTYQYR